MARRRRRRRCLCDDWLVCGFVGNGLWWGGGGSISSMCVLWGWPGHTKVAKEGAGRGVGEVEEGSGRALVVVVVVVSPAAAAAVAVAVAVAAAAAKEGGGHAGYAAASTSVGVGVGVSVPRAGAGTRLVVVAALAVRLGVPRVRCARRDDGRGVVEDAHCLFLCLQLTAASGWPGCWELASWRAPVACCAVRSPSCRRSRRRGERGSRLSAAVAIVACAGSNAVRSEQLMEPQLPKSSPALGTRPGFRETMGGRCRRLWCFQPLPPAHRPTKIVRLGLQMQDPCQNRPLSQGSSGGLARRNGTGLGSQRHD